MTNMSSTGSVTLLAVSGDYLQRHQNICCATTLFYVPRSLPIPKLEEVEYEGKLQVTECLRRGGSSDTLKSKEDGMYLVLCLCQPALEVRTEC